MGIWRIGLGNFGGFRLIKSRFGLFAAIGKKLQTNKNNIMKTKKITFWILFTLFCLVMIADGNAGIMQQDEGKKAFDQLGYPYYVMTIVGAAKILGVIGLLQPNRKVREWAYAGFCFNFIGASASWALSGGPASFVAIPLVMLVIMFVIYWLDQNVRTVFDDANA